MRAAVLLWIPLSLTANRARECRQGRVALLRRQPAVSRANVRAVGTGITCRRRRSVQGRAVRCEVSLAPWEARG